MSASHIVWQVFKHCMVCVQTLSDVCSYIVWCAFNHCVACVKSLFYMFSNLGEAPGLFFFLNPSLNSDGRCTTEIKNRKSKNCILSNKSVNGGLKNEFLFVILNQFYMVVNPG